MTEANLTNQSRLQRNSEVTRSSEEELYSQPHMTRQELQELVGYYGYNVFFPETFWSYNGPFEDYRSVLYTLFDQDEESYARVISGEELRYKCVCMLDQCYDTNVNVCPPPDYEYVLLESWEDIYSGNKYRIEFVVSMAAVAVLHVTQEEDRNFLFMSSLQPHQMRHLIVKVLLEHSLLPESEEMVTYGASKYNRKQEKQTKIIKTLEKKLQKVENKNFGSRNRKKKKNFMKKCVRHGINVLKSSDICKNTVAKDLEFKPESFIDSMSKFFTTDVNSYKIGSLNCKLSEEKIEKLATTFDTFVSAFMAYHSNSTFAKVAWTCVALFMEKSVTKTLLDSLKKRLESDAKMDIKGYMQSLKLSEAMVIFKEMFTDWKSFKQNKYAASMLRTLTLIFSFIKCPSIIVKTTPQWFMKVYKTVMDNDGITNVVDFVSETLLYLGNALDVFISSGSLQGFLITDTKITDLDLRFEEIKLHYEYVKSGRYEEIVSEGHFSFALKVHNLQNDFAELIPGLPFQEANSAKRKVQELVLIKTACRAKASQSVFRIRPLLICTQGHTSIGKTQISKDINKTVSEANCLPYGPEYEYYYKASVGGATAFFDDYESHKIYFNGEDVNFQTKEYVDVVLAQLILNGCGNNSYGMDAASLDKKCKLFFNCLLMNLNTNNGGHNLEHMAKFETPLIRRFDMIPVVKPRDCYKKTNSDGSTSPAMDWSKVPARELDAAFPNIYNVSVYVVEIKENAIHQANMLSVKDEFHTNPQYADDYHRLVPLVTDISDNEGGTRSIVCKNISYYEFHQVLQAFSRKYYNSQLDAMKRAIHNVERQFFCAKCDIPEMNCKCKKMLKTCRRCRLVESQCLCIKDGSSQEEMEMKYMCGFTQMKKKKNKVPYKHALPFRQVANDPFKKNLATLNPESVGETMKETIKYLDLCVKDNFISDVREALTCLQLGRTGLSRIKDIVSNHANGYISALIMVMVERFLKYIRVDEISPTLLIDQSLLRTRACKMIISTHLPWIWKVDYSLCRLKEVLKLVHQSGTSTTIGAATSLFFNMLYVRHGGSLPWKVLKACGSFTTWYALYRMLALYVERYRTIEAKTPVLNLAMAVARKFASFKNKWKATGNAEESFKDRVADVCIDEISDQKEKSDHPLNGAVNDAVLLAGFSYYFSHYVKHVASLYSEKKLVAESELFMSKSELKDFDSMPTPLEPYKYKEIQDPIPLDNPTPSSVSEILKRPTFLLRVYTKSGDNTGAFRLFGYTKDRGYGAIIIPHHFYEAHVGEKVNFFHNGSGKPNSITKNVLLSADHCIQMKDDDGNPMDAVIFTHRSVGTGTDGYKLLPNVIPEGIPYCHMLSLDFEGNVFDDVVRVLAENQCLRVKKLTMKGIFYKWKRHAPGTCMAALVCAVRQNTGVVGLHIGSQQSQYTGFSAGFYITREMVDRSLAFSPESSITCFGVENQILPSHPKFLEALSKYPDARIVPLGSLNARRTVNGDVFEFPFRQRLYDELGMTTGFRMSAIRGANNDEPHFSRDMLLKKVSQPTVSIDPILLKRAEDDFMDPLLAEISAHTDFYKKNVPILNYDEGINGVKMMQYINPINKSTSCGFGLAGKKRMHGEQQGERFIPSPVMEKEINTMWDDLSNDRTSNSLFEVFEKVEVHKEDKIKCRHFYSAGVAMQVNMRRLTQGIVRFALMNRDLSEVMVGINPHSTSWDDFVKHLNTFRGSKYVALDYKDFDVTMGTQVLETVLRMIRRLIVAIGNATAEELRVYDNMCAEVLEAKVNFNGDMFYLIGVLLSGISITSLLGCFANSLYFRCVFFKLFPNKSKFNTWVKLGTYGDDSVAKVHWSLRGFGVNNIIVEMKKMNIQATNCYKDSRIVNYMKLEELTFLKRYFSYNRDFGGYVGKLEETSIWKSLSMVKRPKNVTWQAVAACNFDGALMEYRYYGKKRYEMVRATLEEVANDYNFAPMCTFLTTTYADMVELWSKKYLPADPAHVDPRLHAVRLWVSDFDTV